MAGNDEPLDDNPVEVIADHYAEPAENPNDPWSLLERLPGESHVSHLCVIALACRPIGSRRYSDIAAELDISPRSVANYASLHNFKARLEAFDRAQVRAHLEQAVKDGVEAVATMARFDKAVAEHLVKSLPDLAEVPMTWSEAIRWSQVVAANHRAAVTPAAAVEQAEDDMVDPQASVAAIGAVLAASLDDEHLESMMAAREELQALQPADDS